MTEFRFILRVLGAAVTLALVNLVMLFGVLVPTFGVLTSITAMDIGGAQAGSIILALFMLVMIMVLLGRYNVLTQIVSFFASENLKRSIKDELKEEMKHELFLAKKEVTEDTKKLTDQTR